jgi:hypothetical protein
MIKQYILLGVLIFGVSVLSAQSFGIRAGLNYTKFSGPLEQGVNETNSLSNGFHFGVNYAYKFADRISLKGEILYTQIGTKYDYNGESFYKIPIGTSGYVYEKGNSNIQMKVSNAYIALPITVQFEVSKKIELNVGLYGAFLIGPKGNGTIVFESYENPAGIKFSQSLIHSYNSDAAGESILSRTTGPAIYVDGAVVTLARSAGAYYHYQASEKVGNLYNRYDFGLTGGLSYFINKGFYFGIRYDFGLLDITNNKVDHKRKTYDEVNNLFNFSDDFDRNVGIQASFGFKF